MIRSDNAYEILNIEEMPSVNVDYFAKQQNNTEFFMKLYEYLIDILQPLNFLYIFENL
jgi:hypothetical protein